MRISLVVAMAENRIIGRGNALPWHLPADLHHFKSVTMGKPIVMGRKTHESIGRPLPGRENVVVTRDARRVADQCVAAPTLEAALQRHADGEEIMIVGGAQIYAAALDDAHRIYLTVVHDWPRGDARFPDLLPSEWLESERRERPADGRNPLAMSFVVLDRVSAAVS